MPNIKGFESALKSGARGLQRASAAIKHQLGSLYMIIPNGTFNDYVRSRGGRGVIQFLISLREDRSSIGRLVTGGTVTKKAK